MNGRQAHRMGTVVLSLAMAAIGLALLVQGLLGSSGTATRVLLGVLFLAGGAGRLYVERRRSRT